MRRQTKKYIPIQITDQKRFSMLNNMEDYFQKLTYREWPSHSFNEFSLIGPEDEDRIKFSNIFKEMEKSKNFDPNKLGLQERQSRGIASILGMAICDALGSCTEFLDFDKQGLSLIQNGFDDVLELINKKKLKSRSGQHNIWTDDASMGIAMGISLLYKNYKFDPIHIRYMFILWLWHGLGNGGRKNSIGLGGNIKISMDEFMENRSEYAEKGKQSNNGNGSLMRLAPIPVAFSSDKQEALQYSALQSLTTHNGLQAKQCCRLLASIIVEMINRKQKQDIKNQQKNSQMEVESNKQQPQSWKNILQSVCNKFTCLKNQLKIGDGVQFLAKSQQQSEELFKQNSQNKQFRSFKAFNPKIEDRNWNWKSKGFTYSQSRFNDQPGYIGSYCMDAMAMALHTVWNTSSFKQCALKNANMGGDSDTVGSIAGQIAGSIYGIDKDMLKFYSEMKDFKQKKYEVFLLAYKLINKKKMNRSNEVPPMKNEK